MCGDEDTLEIVYAEDCALLKRVELERVFPGRFRGVDQRFEGDVRRHDGLVAATGRTLNVVDGDAAPEQVRAARGQKNVESRALLTDMHGLLDTKMRISLGR